MFLHKRTDCVSTKLPRKLGALGISHDVANVNHYYVTAYLFRRPIKVLIKFSSSSAMKHDYVHHTERDKRKSVAREKVSPFTVTLDIKIDFRESSNRIKVNKGAAPTNPNAGRHRTTTTTTTTITISNGRKKARCYSNGLIGERKRLTE